MASSDLVAEVVRELARTNARGALFSHAVALRLGIGPTDLECLALLREMGPTTAGQLAELLSLTTGAITGVVDRLEAAGFALRESDPADRRRVIIRPLPERMVEVDSAHEPFLEAARQVLASYTDGDLRLVLDFQRRAAGVLQQETARLKAERSAAGEASELSAPLGQVAAGILEFSNGASEVRIFAAEDPDQLYHASFEAGRPDVRVQDGAITFRYRGMTVFNWRKHAGSVALNPTIPWTIAVRGGASRVSVDARQLELRELRVSGGASNLGVDLSRPRGTVPVCIEGGVNRVQIRRPAWVPVQIQVRGGANRLEFDGRRFGAIGGDLRLASPGWDGAADGYDLDIRGGASRLQIEETPTD